MTHPPHDLIFSGNLSVNPNARFSSNEMYSPQVVCFCDIPVGDLDIHVAKYGPFGIAFFKATLIELGANPIFYVATPARIRDQFSVADFTSDVLRDPTKIDYDKLRRLPEQTIERGAAFDRALPEWHRMVDMLNLLLSRQGPGLPDNHQLRALTLFLEFHVFSFIKCFDPRLDESHEDNFYMEREWRIVGNVHFNLTDISRVLLPREFGRRLRDDFPEYAGQVDFLSQ